MQTFSLPPTVRGIILDIDRTLYDDDAYAEGQVESQYRRAAALWKVSVDHARERVAAWRAEYAQSHDGASQSLGNTLAGLGIPIETSVQWRIEDIEPREHLSPNVDLRRALERLAMSARLIALTNNPVSVGVASLEALGVGEVVTQVVGLDTTGRSKPSTEPFQEALRRLGTLPSETISVGDRYDVDIAPALEVGMGGVQVTGVSEVCELPELLKERLA